MVEQDAEARLVREPELPEREEKLTNVESELEKSLCQLRILRDIFEFFGDNKDEEFNVNGYLEQIEDGKYPLEETYNVLNHMADVGDIRYKNRDNSPCDARIDSDNNPVISPDVFFSPGERPYGMLLGVIDTIYSEAIELADSKKAVEQILSRQAELSADIANIKEIKAVVAEAEERITKKESDIAERNSSLIAEVKRYNSNFEKELSDKFAELIRQCHKEVPALTTEKINKELNRDGKIGSFLQSIQRDIVQYMAIFIAVFALLNINFNGMSGRTMKEFLGINLSLVAGMVTLAALLEFVLWQHGKETQLSKKLCLLWVFAIMLWVITIVILLVLCV